MPNLAPSEAIPGFYPHQGFVQQSENTFKNPPRVKKQGKNIEKEERNCELSSDLNLTSL